MACLKARESTIFGFFNGIKFENLYQFSFFLAGSSLKKVFFKFIY